MFEISFRVILYLFQYLYVNALNETDSYDFIVAHWSFDTVPVGNGLNSFDWTLINPKANCFTEISTTLYHDLDHDGNGFLTVEYNDYKTAGCNQNEARIGIKSPRMDYFVDEKLVISYKAKYVTQQDLEIFKDITPYLEIMSDHIGENILMAFSRGNYFNLYVK